MLLGKRPPHLTLTAVLLNTFKWDALWDKYRREISGAGELFPFSFILYVNTVVMNYCKEKWKF